mmetsp:Transcript_28210/g.74611  ORF Transcript_28210/g.74611 Transcript_28210/m.74611 type:complete len:279 (+) Transcript_28210:503-1339(+)
MKSCVALEVVVLERNGGAWLREGDLHVPVLREGRVHLERQRRVDHPWHRRVAARSVARRRLEVVLRSATVRVAAPRVRLARVRPGVLRLGVPRGRRSDRAVVLQEVHLRAPVTGVVRPVAIVGHVEVAFVDRREGEDAIDVGVHADVGLGDVDVELHVAVKQVEGPFGAHAAARCDGPALVEDHTLPGRRRLRVAPVVPAEFIGRRAEALMLALRVLRGTIAVGLRGPVPGMDGRHARREGCEEQGGGREGWRHGCLPLSRWFVSAEGRRYGGRAEGA